MINIQKIPRLGAYILVFHTLFGCFTADCQVIELHTPQGILKFQVIESQPIILNHVQQAFSPVTHDSITLSGAVPQYMASVQTTMPPVPVPDSVSLTPTGPHYRGVLTAPIDVDIHGKRTVRLDRLLLVHGRPYSPANVKQVYDAFTEATKKELFIRLYDTVIKYRFTPLADSLKDRYGRPMRVKIKRQSNPLLDSLTRKYVLPAFEPLEINEYETKNGLPGLDGKYVVIGVLMDQEETLNRLIKEMVNRKERFYWKLVNR